jgi:hypothetical protein
LRHLRIDILIARSRLQAILDGSGFEVFVDLFFVVVAAFSLLLLLAHGEPGGVDALAGFAEMPEGEGIFEARCLCTLAMTPKNSDGGLT